MNHIQDTAGSILIKGSTGAAATTTFLGFNQWIEANSVLIGLGMTFVFGSIGIYFHYKNLRLSERRVKAMEEQNRIQCEVEENKPEAKQRT